MLFLSALFAGAVYWVHGDIQYDAHRRSISATAIAHGSVLLSFFFAVKAWSYGLDRYPAALRRQRGGDWCGLHRRPCGAARSVVVNRAFDRRGIRRVGAIFECAPTGFPRPRRCSSSAAPSCCPGYPRMIPARVRQTEPAGVGEALHPTQHRVDRAGIQSPSDYAELFPAEQDLTSETLQAKKATIDK